MRDIGKNIKALRTARGLTQDQLAEKLFVTRQTVSNYEVGKSRPDIDALIKIAEVLESDINTVLYGPAPKPDRRKDLTRLALTGGIAVILGVLLFFIQHWANDRKHFLYDLNAAAWLMFVFLPLYFPFLGWILMDGLGLLLKTRPILHRAAIHIRRAVMIFFILYYIAVLPTICFPDLSLPRVWRMTAFWIAYGMRKFPPVPMLLGASLWLCGFPPEKNHKHSKADC